MMKMVILYVFRGGNKMSDFVREYIKAVIEDLDNYLAYVEESEQLGYPADLEDVVSDLHGIIDVELEEQREFKEVLGRE